MKMDIHEYIWLINVLVKEGEQDFNNGEGEFWGSS